MAQCRICYRRRLNNHDLPALPEQGRKREDGHCTFYLLLLLIACGFYLRQFWGISKIRATPAWVLICSGITIILFLLIYWIADINGKAKWFNVIKTGGYEYPYLLYAPLFRIRGCRIAAPFLTRFIIGWGYRINKIFSFLLLMVVLAAYLANGGLRLKL
ncbi:MAG: hypothetical protein WDO19_07430 [Bacteroidota bacterium]